MWSSYQDLCSIDVSVCLSTNVIPHYVDIKTEELKVKPSGGQTQEVIIIVIVMNLNVIFNHS